MLAQDFRTKRIHLALKHGPKACTLESEINPADPREERGDPELRGFRS
jgi:hypothetical protein